MDIRLDKSSPVPLYHQIAERLRYLIATGELRRGDRLPAVREAGERWGVNLHTVRKAYEQLASAELVSMKRAAGTVVLGAAPDAARAPGTASERITVIECTESQCLDLVGQLRERFDIDAEPWSLERAGEPPAGRLLATWFHYNDIRLRWPERFGDTSFVTIMPGAGVADAIDDLGIGADGRALVIDPDPTMAESIAADLQRVADCVFVPTAVQLDNAHKPRLPAADAALFSPRAWAAAPASLRESERCFEVRYVFDDVELARIAGALGWMSGVGEIGR